jgi:nitroimidazol reductase NimA-like FMN-containing flavoprotein (pyridoxamine 5'-phosphate oxidase superfamily)
MEDCMRIDPDEPIFQDDKGKAPAGDDLAQRIRHLTQTQPFGVLCTQGQGQPYGSVVAFAFTDDLRHAIFATLSSTRKYRLLSECDHVALVIDDRPENRTDLMDIQAITVTGRAVEVKRGEGYEEMASLLLDRHTYLESFVRAPSCALFRVDVFRYFHVMRFQEVREWTPPSGD